MVVIILNVYAIGSNSAYDTYIFCHKNDIFNIYCLTTESCSLTMYEYVNLKQIIIIVNVII